MSLGGILYVVNRRNPPNMCTYGFVRFGGHVGGSYWRLSRFDAESSYRGIYSHGYLGRICSDYPIGSADRSLSTLKSYLAQEHDTEPDTRCSFARTAFSFAAVCAQQCDGLGDLAELALQT